MSVSYFARVKVAGMKTVIPEHYIDIDDELQYFDNNPKKLARQKKMIGYGRRYIADDRTTVTDLACDAAKKLMAEMNVLYTRLNKPIPDPRSRARRTDLKPIFRAIGITTRATDQSVCEW